MAEKLQLGQARVCCDLWLQCVSESYSKLGVFSGGVQVAGFDGGKVFRGPSVRVLTASVNMESRNFGPVRTVTYRSASPTSAPLIMAAVGASQAHCMASPNWRLPSSCALCRAPP